MWLVRIGMIIVDPVQNSAHQRLHCLRTSIYLELVMKTGAPWLLLRAAEDIEDGDELLDSFSLQSGMLPA